MDQFRHRALSLNPRYLISSLVLVLLSLMLVRPATADINEPRVLLEDVTHQMIRSINQRQAEIKQNPEVAKQLVEELLLPHIDLITASRWVLGKYWRRASKEQKLAFIRHFREMLLRFYSTALADYLRENTVDEKLITFDPVRAEAGSDDVTVHSEVHPPNGKVIPVNYHMHLTRKGWKVYDVSVEGISVITTYRTSFASEIREHGLDGLISRLADKNNSLVQQPPKPTT
ncbi:MAG: ABC transporter substrate-binding protein [Thiohalophilus sp.]|jgi:phospholipid transport system substrate-binding protein